MADKNLAEQRRGAVTKPTFPWMESIVLTIFIPVMFGGALLWTEWLHPRNLGALSLARGRFYGGLFVLPVFWLAVIVRHRLACRR